MWNKYLVHYVVAVYPGWGDGENIYVSQEKQLLSIDGLDSIHLDLQSKLYDLDVLQE